MELTQEELIEINEALIKPFGHPDPLGYVTRALMLSGGDPEFVDMKGRMGFMPVRTERAMEMTGAESIASLEDNIIATLAMDRILINKYNGDIDKAMIEFHFENSTGNFNAEEREFIENVNEGRLDIKKLLYPRLATVKDVIKLLDDSLVDERLNTSTMNFVEKLMEM